MEIEGVLNTYCWLMESIKARAALMLNLLSDKRGLPPFCVAEILELQIRMISETLAIACLVTHGDVEGARSARLSSAYQADFIMNALERLHPRFFPRATRQIVRDGIPIGIENVTEGFLTNTELIRRYHASAHVLHAGTLNDLITDNQNPVVDEAEVKGWIDRLGVLLDHHTIFLADPPGAWDDQKPFTFLDGEPTPKFHMTVILRSQPTGNAAATVYEAVRQAPQTPTG
jgi:hypothetical protein